MGMVFLFWNFFTAISLSKFHYWNFINWNLLILGIQISLFEFHYLKFIIWISSLNFIIWNLLLKFRDTNFNIEFCYWTFIIWISLFDFHYLNFIIGLSLFEFQIGVSLLEWYFATSMISRTSAFAIDGPLSPPSI